MDRQSGDRQSGDRQSGHPMGRTPRLPPLELGARLDRILACAGRLLDALPVSALDHKPPQRDRSVRDLAFHVFRLSLAYVDGMDMGELRQSWLQEKAPPDLVVADRRGLHVFLSVR